MEKSRATSYRCCFVPKCGNTSKKQPDKVFVCVPKDKKVKKKWFKVSNRLTKPTDSNYFCCEDHFDVSIFLIIEKNVVFRLYYYCVVCITKYYFVVCIYGFKYFPLCTVAITI